MSSADDFLRRRALIAAALKPPTGGGETRSRAPGVEVLHSAKPPDAAGRKGSPSPSAPVAAVPPGQAGHTSTVGASARGGSAPTSAGYELPRRTPGTTTQEVVEGSPFELPNPPAHDGRARRHSKTLSQKQLRHEAKRDVRLNGPRADDYPADADRPKTRGDCFGGPRPCPFVSCRYHTYLDITPKGSLVIHRPDVDVAELKASCVLDIADAGAVTLEQAGAVLNVTRERMRQVEAKALAKVKRLVDQRPDGEVRFRRQCRAVDAFTGLSCKLLEHPPGSDHHSERGVFRVAAAPGQTRFAERERLDEQATRNPESMPLEASNV